MVKEVTFLDTSLPNYADLSKALVSQGWTGVRSTSGNRFQIQVKYAYYLANNLAAHRGTSASALSPADLAAIWSQAGTEAPRFEMYVKESGTSPMEMNNNIAASEEFASAENVERMQPHYQDIEDILAGLGGLSFGGKMYKKHRGYKKSRGHKKTHKKSRSHRKTARKNKKSKRGGYKKTRRNKRN
jgi:hypothetical protein